MVDLEMSRDKCMHTMRSRDMEWSNLEFSTKTSSTNSTYDMWNYYNNMVKAWILNSLSQDLGNNVIYVDREIENWPDLKEHFLNPMPFVSYKLREILSF